jgi:hypothetical protein
MSTALRRVWRGNVRPDGIRESDWEAVHELAVAIVNATSTQDGEALRGRMFFCLDELQRQYGERPSILMIRADYLDDFAEAERLLIRAYDLANLSRDDHNSFLVASSLASLYAFDLNEGAKAREWLSKARAYTEQAGDEGGRWQCERIEKQIQSIERDRQS